MLSTNFDAISLESLNGLIKEVLNNQYSHLYVDKYVSALPEKITTYVAFQKIPPLTKNEFLALPLRARTFVPHEKIAYYSFSSGTTQKNKPSVIPHSSLYHEALKKHLIREDLLAQLEVNKIIILMPPLSPPFLRTLKADFKKLIAIPGDIHNFPLTARVAQELEVEGFFSTPTIFEFFLEELRKINYDLQKIKWVCFGGEFFSTARMSYFKKELPNAVFSMRYGNSEIGDARHYKCQHLLDEFAPNVFHIDPAKELLEIVNEQGMPLPLGEAGEILHTDLLAGKAFPFIRYRTRDVGILQRYDCPCGNGYILTVEGKADLDVLKIQGVVLKTEAISQAIKHSCDYLESRFQLHVYEETCQDKVKPRLILHLRLASGHAQLESDNLFRETLARNIGHKLKLSNSATLAQLIARDVFLPLELVFISNWSTQDLKSKNIISHLE